MSATTDILIKNLAKNIVENQNKKPSAYDTQAEVRRIEGDTAWVHIPGGVDETPVQLTTNAKKGDIVQVRVSGGRAWLYGNATAPPTDDTKAIIAEKKAVVADEHATNAISSAMIAQEAADSAQTSASVASAAAARAESKADIADGAATRAITKAEEAISQIETIETAIENIDDDIESIETRVTTAEGKITTTEGNITTLQGRVSTAEGKITTAETAIENIDDDIESLETRVTTAEGKITTAETAIENIDDDIESIETRVTTAEGKITTTEGDISALQGRVSTTEGKITTAEGEIAIVEGDISTLQGRVTSAENTVASIEGELDDTIHGLSLAQDVVGTVNWITSHGTMSLSADTSVNLTKVYYIRDNNGDYIVGQYKYSIVKEPTGNPHDNNYYELELDSSVNNYIASHISMTNAGLVVMKDNSKWKVLIKDNGIDIIDNTTGVNKVVASYGSNIMLGSGNYSVAHAEIDYHSFQMIDSHGNPFMNVSDLRNNDGIAEITTVYYGDGETTSFTIDPLADDLTYTVTVSDSSGGTITKGTTSVQFSSPPSNGSIITIVYTTSNFKAKAYTFGLRQSNSNVGAMSFAEGLYTIASASASHAEGNRSKANGEGSHAEGVYSEANGEGSHAEGGWTTATGVNSHSEGWHTNANGSYSHSEGSYTIADGMHSHAEGHSTTASGSASHAEGDETTASGAYSHAEGCDVQATGEASHSEGNYTLASGFYSHAQNNYTRAIGTSQTALGRFNSDNAAAAVIIGNGTGESARSNALEVEWSGNVYMALNTEAQVGTLDRYLYLAIEELGWENDVIV